MRREKSITINDDGRDKGKTFLIKEMSALKAERWATKALVALVNSGVLIPDDKVNQGMAAIAEIGLPSLTRLNAETVQDLMDEMFGCIQIVEPNITRIPTEDDIEEVKTRILLRAEVFSLHTGFSLAGPISRLTSALQPQVFSATPTSQG